MPYIEQVVQFMVPSSLSIWMQRAGRAGQTFTIFARVILLVQPSVFQEVKMRKGVPIPESEGTVYRKDVEEALRAWIETEDCRRDITDEYFDSGVARKDPTGVCCDNCLRKTTPDHALLSKRSPTIDQPGLPSPDTEDSPRQVDANGKRGMDEAASVRRSWGYQAFLPDKVLTAVATKARFTTINDLISGGWSPTHARKHDAEKEECARLRREETLAARNQKKIISAAVKARVKELCAVACAAAPKAAPKPRPSRSKKARIEQENLPPAPNFPFLPHPPTPYTPVRSMDIGSLPYAHSCLAHILHVSSHTDPHPSKPIPSLFRGDESSPTFATL
ncbi:hypothetical protein B0H14DRAFT_2590171 [Mycena olivaceomarginata]|nr:hypothetical protein B0H14DRAFT_2590171 [Mycena olivaceomarginata]